MVDPDTGAVLNRDAVVAHDLADRKVADDDIGRVANRDASTSNHCALADAND